MNNNNVYLLDVDNNYIFVNEHTTLDKENTVKNELMFQLLNPNRLEPIVFENPNNVTAEYILDKLQRHEQVKDTSYLRFFFPIGNKIGDFIDKERGGLISFETELGEWTVSKPGFIDDHICFIASSKQRKVIDSIFSIYFKCKNIQSYAPVGLTYFYVQIENVVGIPNMIKVFPMKKTKAKPSIHRFYSKQTTVGKKQSIQLEWDTSSAQAGYIMPDGINIFNLPAKSYVTTNDRNIEYQLVLSGQSNETRAALNTYISPPFMEVNYEVQVKDDVETMILSWNTKYTEVLYLYVGSESPKAVKENDTDYINMPQVPQVMLHAQGAIYSEYKLLNLLGLTFEEEQCFTATVRVYSHYVHTRWEWTTEHMTSATFEFRDENKIWRVGSSELTGAFEYVSTSPLPYAKVTYVNSKGEKCPVLQLNGEVI